MKILFLKMSTSFFTQMSQKATVVYHRNSISIHSVLVKKQRFWFCSSDKTITFCIIPLDYMFDSRMLDKSNLCLTPQTAGERSRSFQLHGYNKSWFVALLILVKSYLKVHVYCSWEFSDNVDDFFISRICTKTYSMLK